MRLSATYMDGRKHEKVFKKRYHLTKFFTKMVREKLIMIKFWKSMKNALSKFLKLKTTTKLLK